MTRSNSNGDHNPRRQRPTAFQLHSQYHRRSNDLLPSYSLPLRPPPPRKFDHRNDSNPSRLQPRRRPPEQASSVQRQREDGRPHEHGDRREAEHRLISDRRQQDTVVEQRIGSYSAYRGLLQQHSSLQRLPPSQSMAVYEPERRREDERRLAAGPREFGVPRASDISISQALLQQVSQTRRAAIHEQNRTAELTRLNAVMVQRNNTIAEAQSNIAAQNEEIGKLRQALDERTKMAVALHGICSRHQEFLKSIPGSICAADEGQNMQFQAWVRSNEFYITHVKEVIAAERDWNSVAREANSEAMEEIRKAAYLAVQRLAQQMNVVQPSGQESTPQASNQPNGRPSHGTFHHALQQLIDETTIERSA